MTILRAGLIITMLAVVACGDSSTKNPDLAMMVSDNKFDLKMDPGNTCYQVLSCSLTCSGEPSCESTCVAKGSMTAQTQYNALFSCAYAICTTSQPGDGGQGDGGVACANDADTSGPCNTCVLAAAASTQCATQRTDCLGG